MKLPFCMMAMPRIGKSLLISAFYFCFIAIISATQTATGYEYESNNHTFKLGARARIANINADTDAQAGSLLVRLNVTSKWTPQLTTLLEVDHVELAWQNKFSNGVHFNGHPVIPDVAGTDLNQALIRYTPTNTLQLTLGREAINLGNERFVGTNGFWQNEQTLDTVGFKYEFGFASSVIYRYVDNANRINGEGAGKKLSPSDSNFAINNGLRPAPFLGDHDHNTHLLFANFKEWDFAQVQAYYFDMDIKDAKALSNQTLGLRYEYKGRWKNLRTLANAEWALQQRTGINNNDTLQFFDISAGMGYDSSEVTINFQRLGERNGSSFVTPLASLHDHNGWADKFLITPSSGLRDYSLHYIWRQNPIKIDARYHAFQNDINDSMIAEELDIDLSLKLSRNNRVLLRIADFSAKDTAYTDEQRVFLMFSHAI